MSEPTFADLTEIAKRVRVPKEELETVVRRLAERCDPLRIYLFGSHFWGKPHWKSDLDFCILVPTNELADSLFDVAMEVVRDFERKETDLLLLSQGQFEEVLSNPASMEHRIFHEGDMLYSKPNLVFDRKKPLVRIEREILETANGHLNSVFRLMGYPPLPKFALFHVQQTVEESLRAFRAFHLQKLIKTHDLVEMRNLCLELTPVIGEIEGFGFEDAKRLTKYYTLRYKRVRDAVIPERPVIDADIRLAERIYRFVEQYIDTHEPPTSPTRVPGPVVEGGEKLA